MIQYRSTRAFFVAAAIFTFIVGMLAWVEAGSSDDARCKASVWLWFGCAAAKHENLTGGLLGAGGALFAAWLAWTAVQRQIQRQIQAERQLAREEQEASLEAVTDQLGEFLKIYREIFHILSFTSSRADDDELERWVDFLRMKFHFLPTVEEIEKLSAIGSNIRARQKLKLEAIVRSLLQVNMAAEAFGADADVETSGRARVEVLTLAYGHLEQVLSAFDPQTGPWFFAGRPPKKTLIVEQIRSGLINFLNENPLRTPAAEAPAAKFLEAHSQDLDARIAAAKARARSRPPYS
jgi:hypothetical protein